MPTDWAVVVATFVGPITAVGITLWYTNRQDRARETRTNAKAKADELYARRLQIFRTLMATRRVGINPDHVSALNLIEVDFYKCEKVESAWKAYKAHLFLKNIPAGDPEWEKEKEKLLARLLFQIGIVLDFNIPELDIYEGGYSPEGWAWRDSLQSEVLGFFRELRRGEKLFPIWAAVHVNEPQAPQIAAPDQMSSELADLYAPDPEKAEKS